MPDPKYSSLQVYNAAELMLTTLYRRFDSDPLRVIPSGMALTPAGSMDASFLASWNKQMLGILRNQTDIKVSTRVMEDITMTENEGFSVLVGFLGHYEKTLMSDQQMQQLMASLRAEQKLPIEDRPVNGYWKQWLSFLSMVKS